MFKNLAPMATPITFKELFLSGLKIGDNNEVKEFEEIFSENMGARYSFAVSTGKAGLYVILKTLAGLSNRRKVIIPAYTCPVVAASIVKAELKVVLCDISPLSFDYDLEQLNRLIDEDTLAVIMVHLFGIPVESEKISKTAAKKGVYIIEDSAQFAKGTNNGYSSLKGDIAFYSLGRGKNINTGGGGVIVTDNKEYADKARLILNNGHNQNRLSGFSSFLQLLAYKIFISPSLYFIPQNLPFLGLGKTIYSTDFKISHLSSFQARLGISMLEKLNELNKSLREKALFYRNELMNIEGISTIDDRDENIYLRFPIFIKDEIKREKIYREARRQGLGITKMYPEPLDRIGELKPHLSNVESYPNAERISKSILTLPNHYLVKEKDMIRILQIIKKHL